jgi:hypothetical protein
MTRSGCREQGPRLPFSFDASTRELGVPITADKGKQLKLVFWFSDAASTHKLGLSEDQPALAIAFTTVRFKPSTTATWTDEKPQRRCGARRHEDPMRRRDFRGVRFG